MTLTLRPMSNQSRSLRALIQVTKKTWPVQKAVRYVASGSEESVSSTVAGGGEAHKGYGSTAAKQGQLMESKTSGSARKVQKSDERWPALWPTWNDNVVVIISWGTTRTAGTKKRTQYQHQANKMRKKKGKTEGRRCRRSPQLALLLRLLPSPPEKLT